MRIIEGNLNGLSLKVAIVASRFNHFITDQLVKGSIDTLKRHGVLDDAITLVWVPGAFEIPLAVHALASQKKYTGLVALGAVIRGGTPHFEYVCSQAIQGISKASLAYKIPIGMGILTTNTVEEAIERSGTKLGNKGEEAAKTVIEMATLLQHPLLND